MQILFVLLLHRLLKSGAGAIYDRRTIPTTTLSTITHRIFTSVMKISFFLWLTYLGQQSETSTRAGLTEKKFKDSYFTVKFIRFLTNIQKYLWYIILVLSGYFVSWKYNIIKLALRFESRLQNTFHLTWPAKNLIDLKFFKLYKIFTKARYL